MRVPGRIEGTDKVYVATWAALLTIQAHKRTADEKIAVVGLPTLGTGRYEWRGFLSEREHPHAVSGPGGLLLNWNNRSAPGFMHGDDDPFGSVHRVELFNRFVKVMEHEETGAEDL